MKRDPQRVARPKKPADGAIGLCRRMSNTIGHCFKTFSSNTHTNWTGR